MSRYDISELEWRFIHRILPAKVRGVKRRDDRQILNGIFYVFRTGWVSVVGFAARHEPCTTVYNRFRRSALALFFVFAFASPAMAEWYKGGSLHRAMAAEWNSATPANRLATAGDWSAAMLGEACVRRMGLGGVREYAQKLVICVSEAVPDGPSNLVVSEIAAACFILMGE